MKRTTNKFEEYFPILTWGRTYTKKTFSNDLIVAFIVSIMLIPQSLAYAQLAGLPAEVGLYASMAPLLIYAIFGTSRTLSIGPVAVASLMTAAAIAPLAAKGTPEYLGAAMALAFISGLLLIVFGLLKLGFLANFLSHPVISGFITASGVQIAAGQLTPLLGIPSEGESFLDIVITLTGNISHFNLYTALIGVSSLVLLYFSQHKLSAILMKFGIKKRLADILTKAGPVFLMAATTSIVAIYRLDAQGVGIVGNVPSGLPKIAIPTFDLQLWTQLLVPAILISIVGYVESISVAQTLAAKKRQRIDPDQELIAIGAANISSSVAGGFPVTGGFSRSIVNFNAGAETPAAGIFTAVGIALAALFLTPWLFFLPNATLAAVIIVAVLSLVKIGAVRHAFSYSPADGIAMGITILLTLVEGIEIGLIAGVSISLVMHLFKTSKPHVAIVGQVPGTEHFRNIKRHKVETSPEIISLRVDESLYFPNARFLEDKVNELVADNPDMRHFILNCSAVNSIDISALESLMAINQRLKDADILLHLCEIKGPIMDRLNKSSLPKALDGRIHLTQYEAVHSINSSFAEKTFNNK